MLAVGKFSEYYTNVMSFTCINHKRNLTTRYV